MSTVPTPSLPLEVHHQLLQMSMEDPITATNHPVNRRLELLRSREIQSEPPSEADSDSDAETSRKLDQSDTPQKPKSRRDDSFGSGSSDPIPKSHAVQLSSRTKSAFSLPSQSTTSINDRGLITYERVVEDLATNTETHRQIAIGKRVGFYRLGKELGAGNFSKVKIGVHVLTNERVAVKIMDKAKMDPKAQKLLSSEINNMEKCAHPNIIRLFEVVETLNRVFLVVEYARGGELYQFVQERGKLKEEDTRPLFAQITAAVDHMHTLRIAHRDIKAENVMFSEPGGTLKLVDFGFSRPLGDANLETFCGSPPYAAPELFKDKSYEGRPVDVWAMGVLLYFMLVGVTPFRGETIQDLKQRVMEGKFTIPDYLSIFAQELLRRMLELDPKCRLTVQEIKRMYWLRNMRFPASYKEDDQDVETVMERMSALGIDEEPLKEAWTKGPRSEIVGTYRLVTYQVKRELKDLTLKAKEAKEKEEAAALGNSLSKNHQTSDKVCTIL